MFTIGPQTGMSADVLPRRELDSDGVARADDPSSDDDGHDATLSFDRTVLGPAEHLAQQPRFEAVDLFARVPQSGDPHACIIAEVQQRVRRQAKQIDSASRHILAQLSRRDREPRARDLVEQLRVHQVHLPQIRLRRVAGDAGPVLDRGAGVRIAFHAPPFDEDDVVDDGLAEPMVVILAHSDDEGPHFLIRAHSQSLSRTDPPWRTSTIGTSRPAGTILMGRRGRCVPRR